MVAAPLVSNFYAIEMQLVHFQIFDGESTVKVRATNEMSSSSSSTVGAAVKDNICSLTGEQQPRLLSTLAGIEVNTAAPASRTLRAAGSLGLQPSR